MYDNSLLLGLLKCRKSLYCSGISGRAPALQVFPFMGGSVWGDLYRGLHIDPGAGEMKNFDL